MGKHDNKESKSAGVLAYLSVSWLMKKIDCTIHNVSFSPTPLPQGSWGHGDIVYVYVCIEFTFGLSSGWFFQYDKKTDCDTHVCCFQKRTEPALPLLKDLFLTLWRLSSCGAWPESLRKVQRKHCHRLLWASFHKALWDMWGWRGRDKSRGVWWQSSTMLPKCSGGSRPWHEYAQDSFLQ